MYSGWHSSVRGGSYFSIAVCVHDVNTQKDPEGTWTCTADSLFLFSLSWPLFSLRLDHQSFWDPVICHKNKIDMTDNWMSGSHTQNWNTKIKGEFTRIVRAVYWKNSFSHQHFYISLFRQTSRGSICLWMFPRHKKLHKSKPGQQVFLRQSSSHGAQIWIRQPAWGVVIHFSIKKPWVSITYAPGLLGIIILKHCQ